MAEHIVTSKATGRDYNVFGIVAIKNLRQAGLYWLNDVKPVDYEFIRNKTSNEPQLIFYYDRNETKEVYDKWCNYELK